MALSTIEQQVRANMRGLPLDKQQSILDFSLFLVNAPAKKPAQSMARDSASFAVTNPLILVTRNRNDFINFSDLQLDNWILD